MSFDLLPGNWHYRCTAVQDTPLGTRVAILGIHHEDHELAPSVRRDGSLDPMGFTEPTSTQTLGVDSARFGFFDGGMFWNDAACKEAGYSSWEHSLESCKTIDAVEASYSSWEHILESCKTVDGVTPPPGIVSASGFGDGEYKLQSYMDGQKLKAAFIRFISEEEVEQISGWMVDRMATSLKVYSRAGGPAWSALPLQARQP